MKHREHQNNVKWYDNISSTNTTSATTCSILNSILNKYKGSSLFAHSWLQTYNIVISTLIINIIILDVCA